MTETPGVKTVDLKWFGKLTPKQILVIVVAFIAALILTVFGFGSSCMCFGMLIIAIILYMLPRLMGVDNVKIMTVVGVVFTVSALLIGGLFTAPGFVEANQGNPSDNDHFSDITYEYVDGGMNITATRNSDVGVHEIYFSYGEVRGVGFMTINAVLDQKVQLTVTGNSVSGHVDLDPNTLFTGRLVETVTNGDEEIISNDSPHSYTTFMTEAYDGDISGLCFYGCFIGVMYITIVFFMILIFSTFMRSRMEKTREKLEKEGRLYPQGYGRCDNCGTVVLPGEVNCRKCGAYIDRPEEMKPKKKDYFECSECGSEVPNDAVECPKCGVKFDEDEFEVVHADGTVEVTKDTFECSECGSEVPSTASFCPKCGAKFDEEE